MPMFVVVLTPDNSSAQSGRDCEPGCVTATMSQTLGSGWQGVEQTAIDQSEAMIIYNLQSQDEEKQSKPSFHSSFYFNENFEKFRKICI